MDRINFYWLVMARYIKALREKRDLTQGYVAMKLGISRPTYILLENGKRDLTVKEAKKLAKVFGIGLNDLLMEKDITEPKVELEKGKKEEKEKDPGIRISVPKKDVVKFQEVFLYILEKIGAKPNVGEAVICKILYFIDFDYYELYEEQLMGAVYIKNHYGPTPAAFLKIVTEMKKKKDIIMVENKIFKYLQKKYLPLRKANLGGFKANEIKVIDDVIERYKDKTAKEMEEISHRDVPWIGSEHQKVIDYESVFYRTPEFSVRNYGEEED